MPSDDAERIRALGYRHRWLMGCCCGSCCCCLHLAALHGADGTVFFSRELFTMSLNIPNTLTWGRIALIPIFVGVFYLPESVMTMATKNLVATTLFIVAAVTDWFDGYLARSLGQTSAFGAFLDPVADKLMVAAALILLVQLGRVDAIIAVVIIGREITISALREWMARVGRSASVAVATVGKLKTTAQMIAIPLLLYATPFAGLDVDLLGTLLIYAATALTLWSMGYYLHRALPQLKESEKIEKTVDTSSK